MRWLFWTLLILASAIGVSLLASYNEGYVLIVRAPYRLEISLNFLLILIVLAFVLLHLGLRLMHYTKRLPASVREYKEQQRIKNGHTALVEALHALVEGRYLVAEKTASKALELGEDAGLSALIAARASHKLKHRSKRDYYFAEAERLAPDAAIARLLSQAELQLDDRQYDDAINTLNKLYKIEAHHVPALRLELKAQIHLNSWEQVLAILLQLEKRDAIESWHLKEIRQQAHQQIIKRYTDDLPALNAYWKKLPDDDRLNSRLAYSTAEIFIRNGTASHVAGGEQFGNIAAEIIEMSLTKKWDNKLAGLLGDCVTSNPQKQLQQAEYWLLSHEGDANLLLSLGNMCVRQGLWGKAQSYLEASISVEDMPATHIALAKLLESLDDIEGANQHYRISSKLFTEAA
ncbi:MAG: heme biosynthesis protein HemY [Methylophilaceae bacterium]